MSYVTKMTNEELVEAAGTLQTNLGPMAAAEMNRRVLDGLRDLDDDLKTLHHSMATSADKAETANRRLYALTVAIAVMTAVLVALTIALFVTA